MQAVQFVVNGRACSAPGPSRRRLIDVLREDLGLLGTREGCGDGECGACQVLLDGRPVPACDTPLEAVDGRDVLTVEGLAQLPEGAALVRAFVAEQAAQCGYCSSGVLVAATALLRAQPQPDDASVRRVLDPHLCRCGAHPRILRAVRRAAQELAR